VVSSSKPELWFHKHLETFWPGAVQESFEWTRGPILRILPRFSVVRIAPATDRAPWIYVSHGASEIQTAQGYGMEFMLMSPVEDPIHVESLAMVANFHADPKYRLSVGKAISIGRPWMNSSPCDYFVVSLPYTVGPEFEWCKVGDRLVRFLWLLPITSGEADFAASKGLEALETRFEQAGFNVVDPGRAPVV
jgi:Suppressor of fused protein (SUFU)